jgi:hypothetical protein
VDIHLRDVYSNLCAEFEFCGCLSLSSSTNSIQQIGTGNLDLNVALGNVCVIHTNGIADIQSNNRHTFGYVLSNICAEIIHDSHCSLAQ